MGANEDIGACLAACAGYLGRTVIYARGTTTASVTACPGGQPVSLIPIESMAAQQHVRQWYVATAALAAFGRPAVGDTITDGSDVWLVTEMDGGPCYAYADPASVVLRIYAKRTA